MKQAYQKKGRKELCDVREIKHSMGDRRCGGSSMVYVILTITHMVTLSCGYMVISHRSLQSALRTRKYLKASLSAKSMHRGFCEAVSRGDSPSMNLIWDEFDADCLELRETYEEEMEMAQDREGDSRKQTDWEEYLKEYLGDKEYVIEGYGEDVSNRLKVHITVRAKPMHERAFVETAVTEDGYQMSLESEIRFDGALDSGD